MECKRLETKGGALVTIFLGKHFGKSLNCSCVHVIFVHRPRARGAPTTRRVSEGIRILAILFYDLTLKIGRSAGLPQPSQPPRIMIRFFCSLD